ncbi:endonuclease domain-containing protein [Sphingomonas radiodurans]|uniref:endonuclease domain-containing protein n=1 Tax=Sphingomonas radiodurans TaxID=2890321 RepID=UPI001E4C3957|nr:endonuclease domain-containing protein [Sphingomonas radiodurans]WBH16123.1 endonuclease domain-containing protein [Sphingomonas radiodurans]
MLRPEVVIARKLRRVMSYPEVPLWQRLRGGVVRFRRQHPIGPYVVDFYCAEARLVIEVDGEVHSQPRAIDDDASRDRFLTDNGYRVLRIPAADILSHADEVAASIASLVARPLHHRPAVGGPPPRAGEDQE